MNKEQLIEREIDKVYFANRFNNFTISDQRKFDQEIEELRIFLNNIYMKKSEVKRNHDNFNWEKLIN